MSGILEIQRNGEAATIWMNRPEVSNAFDDKMVGALSEAFAALTDDAAIRVIVLGGRGRNFSAGADLRAMQAAGAAGFEANYEDAQKLAAMLRLIADSRKPTIARVQGQALGGGMGLASACDICVAASNASFALTEVRMGLIPATISPYVLRAIGPRQALRYFQTGERIPAARAVEIGLAHEVADAEHLDARIAKIVESLLLGAPRAQAAAKDLVHDFTGRGIDSELLNDTARRIAHARASAEARDGIAAFLGKGQPPWVKE